MAQFRVRPIFRLKYISQFGNHYTDIQIAYCHISLDLLIFPYIGHTIYVMKVLKFNTIDLNITKKCQKVSINRMYLSKSIGKETIQSSLFLVLSFRVRNFVFVITTFVAIISGRLITTVIITIVTKRCYSVYSTSSFSSLLSCDSSHDENIQKASISLCV